MGSIIGEAPFNVLIKSKCYLDTVPLAVKTGFTFAQTYQAMSSALVQTVDPFAVVDPTWAADCLQYALWDTVTNS